MAKRKTEMFYGNLYRRCRVAEVETKLWILMGIKGILSVPYFRVMDTFKLYGNTFIFIFGIFNRSMEAFCVSVCIGIFCVCSAYVKMIAIQYIYTYWANVRIILYIWISSPILFNDGTANNLSPVLCFYFCYVVVDIDATVPLKICLAL